MKLKDYNFNSIKETCTDLCNLAIKVENTDKWYEEYSVGATLKVIPIEFADMEIAETRWFFNTFVIILKNMTKEE